MEKPRQDSNYSEHAEKLAERDSDSVSASASPDHVSAGHVSATHVENLENLGLEQQTARYIGAFETIAVGWTICSSWLGVLAVLLLILAAGGTVTMLYGVLLIWVVYGFIIATLAELSSVYPTAGGQYHWTNILAHQSYARGLSYTCGFINMFSWIAIAAGVDIILPQLILTMVVEYNPTFIPKRWHTFLIYEAFNLLNILLNMFALRKAMWIYNASAILSVTSFLVIMIVCLARAPTFQPTEFVWTEFLNYTGWSSKGLVFFIGLLGCNYMYTGIDGAIHLAEECINAAQAVPRALISTWVIGFLTTFPICIAMAYTGQDWQSILAAGFPIYELWKEACRSSVAATVFSVSLLFVGDAATIGCYQTASRLTWAMARDDALIGSKWLGRMHKKLEAPIWAIIANGVIVFIMGLIYLGSSTAFNAFIGSGILLNVLTFIFPAALLMIRGRSEHFLPSNRSFKLPSALGWVANFFTVAFPLIVLVFYDFPVIYPVTAGNMNYTCAVLGVIGFLGLINWVAWAREHYRGPTIVQR